MNYTESLSVIADLDAGIHNPARLMIVYLLSRQNNLDYLTLMSQTRLSSGNITTHLNKLQQCGYIKIIKSFRGRKPHTAIELSEEGRQAYLNWGEMILQALPKEIHNNIRSRILHQELNLTRYNLSLRDWLPVASDRPAAFSMANKNGRGIAWPPLDEAWTW